MREFISVKEAKEIIQSNITVLSSETFQLKDAAGLTLAEDVYPTYNFPPFRQSAMDGYAFRFDDWKGDALVINGEVPAGATAEISTGNKEAVRIFTGAPVPAELDTVVMQEKASVKESRLEILDEGLTKGSNVRPIGSEIPAETLALEKGTLLTPGAIGFLAGIGKKEVQAIRRPSVTIIVTGRELQKPGEPLLYGQVYESNSSALIAALQNVGITKITSYWCDDNIEELSRLIETSMLACDLLLLTGGVSVGDYDFVTKSLEQIGAQKLFHKIKQRPGKPLLFCKKDETLIFGLPGNPSSVLTCFYEYVLLAIQQMQWYQKPFLTSVQLPIGCDYNKKTSLKHFLKGKLGNNEAIILDAQDSYRMKSFAIADCLIVLEEDKMDYKKGEPVEVHILP